MSQSTIKAPREFCATCGWPLGGPRCEGCGGDAVPLPLHDGTPKLEAPDTRLDVRLDRAFDAFRGRDWARMISYCLGTEPSWGSRAVTQREGPAWILTLADATLFLWIDPALGIVAIESPLVRLPQRQRVPALRYALELSARDEPGRICLRGDLLVLRFAGHLTAVSPPALIGAIRRSAIFSEQVLVELSTKLEARPAILPSERASIGWDVLGRPRSLAHLAPPASTRATTTRALEPEEPPPSSEGDDSLPAILSPMFAGGGGTPPPRSRISGVHAPSRPTLSELAVAVESAPRRPSAAPPPAASPDAERLCDLLRQAQALATVLSFEEKPATMMLLVRSTVYRAIYSHAEALPDAVAHLHRSTAGAMKEIWLSPPRRTQSTQIPIAEPALLVMERIVGAHAQVPKEKTLAIEPLTSATQAKEHLARYLGEIEKAPADPNLRHFLALGALTELLVRTKLPAQTQQRLREIIEYAQRDGKKPESIELMMTALGRIVAP